ncbi:unnamed protein product [Polarella glacialis]|uniref:Mitochondrial splicing suppressor 51-like C-terminal domain-containing protein n=1 Tax=Polarella glacialis TaxID=89957 RepID=A0A813DPB8_POLGL|nr:unnamed protein product [Polarella glacialis]
MLDGLSFPLSLAWVLCKSEAVRWAKSSGDGKLHIVVLGATSKGEVRTLKQSRYWLELDVLLEGYCRPHLHFVGPEIDSLPGDSADIHCLSPPCASRFLKSRPDLTAENTVCVVFNGGFGNFVSAGQDVASGRDDLLWSWLPDLLFMADSEYFCAFFCANDYADLRGEMGVHTALLGSRFVLAPQRNPFSMATTYSGEGGEGSQEWFSGNSFVYATCGCEPSARHPAASADVSADSVAARSSMAKAVFSKVGVVDGSVSSGIPSLEVCAGTPPMLRPQRPKQEREGKGDAGYPKAATTSATRPAEAPSASASSMKTMPTEREPTTSPKTSTPPLSTECGPGVSGKSDGIDVHLTKPSSKPAVIIRSEEAEDGSRFWRFEVSLPGIAAVDDLDLQISDTAVALSTAEGVRMYEPWPELVNSSQAAASFSSKKGRLVIKVPMA